MANYDFSVNGNDIILEALQILGVLGEGQVPTAQQTTDAMRKLNLMAMHWQSDGLQLWARKQQFVFVDRGVATYSLGAGGARAVTAYTYSTLSLNVASGDLTVTLDDIVTTGAGVYTIGVINSVTNVRTWFTGASSVGTAVVTLTGAAGIAALAGSTVFMYLTAALISRRPMRILNVNYRRNDSSDVYLNVISQSEYDQYANKIIEGAYPSSYHYDPQLGKGDLVIWATPGTNDLVLVVRYNSPFTDFDATTDLPDFPQEWYLALCYGLASLLAANYRLPLSERRVLAAEAAQIKQEVMNFDQEQASLYFQPTGGRNSGGLFTKTTR